MEIRPQMHGFVIRPFVVGFVIRPLCDTRQSHSACDNDLSGMMFAGNLFLCKRTVPQA